MDDGFRIDLSVSNKSMCYPKMWSRYATRERMRTTRPPQVTVYCLLIYYLPQPAQAHAQAQERPPPPPARPLLLLGGGGGGLVILVTRLVNSFKFPMTFC